MVTNISPTSTNQYLKDLEKCGIATSNNLREILTTCSDPVEAIKQFQLANNVQLPSLKPVMKLLDLHGISRTDYHETVVNELTERLISKIGSLGTSQTPENIHRLERHLERCFRLYRVPRIRPIVLETLAKLPKVADRYLKLIICDKELYDQCAVSVRQQIWVKNETLFLESIEPIIDSYISEESRQHLIFVEKKSSGDILNELNNEQGGQQQQQLRSPVINFTSCFFAGEGATKQRRQRKQVQELISMIGLREQLYTRLVETLRERFISTENFYYCSLRFDLLMALRDVNMEFCGKVDVCHDFAWCLDACSKHLRTKLLDAQQLNKLKTLLESGGGGKKCQNKAIIIPEMAMIAGDPHILHLLASFAVRMLRDNAGSPRPHLPKEMGSLQLLLKLLLMGVYARSLLLGEENFVNLIERELKEINGHFLPAFSTMIVQDAIRAECQISSSIKILEDLYFKQRPSCIDMFIKEKFLCSLLWFHHLILGGDYCPLSGTIKRKQLFEPLIAFKFSEPLICMNKQLAIKDPWVQLLVQKLVQFSGCLSNELTANLFIQSFFIPNLKSIPNSIIKKKKKELEEGEVNEEEDEEIDDKILVKSFVKEFGKWREQLEETRLSRGGVGIPLRISSSSTTINTTIETKQQFLDFINSEGKFTKIVLFWADWSEACADYDKLILEIKKDEKEYGEDYQIIKLMAEGNEELAAEYKVNSVPTILAFQILELRASGNYRRLSTDKTEGIIDTTKKKEKSEEEKKEELNERLKRLINKERLTLFMKGSPSEPKCGFSQQIVKLLKSHNVQFWTFDILLDEQVRQDLDGELLGGIDVVREEMKDPAFVEKLPKLQ
ncbi:hypothetical protein Mgra_00007365 [Meloidogyne graminicola]|uniref:Thioredoxin domain-containing protein n=1 Tax=Meloidogyne graminicola TaxID=189291 RepID=A0A8S9ZIU5_9BILA|nr:hypothetical protein Mgra_00007365 [Meloidogyne graminicola]